jgi:hypothetical protein
MMEDPEVIIGQVYQQAFGGPTSWMRWAGETPKNPRRIPMAQACEEMAKYWNCTPNNARESLLKHGYASSPNRDWRVAGRGFDEGEKW